MRRNAFVRRPSIAMDVLVGAAGGIIGTFVMNRVTALLYRFEDESKKRREAAAQREPAPMLLASRMLRLAGIFPTRGRKRALGTLIDWSYGAFWGGLYGYLRRRAPIVARGRGLPFGLALTLVGDELLTTLMGLAPPPQAFPIDTHVRSLVGHLAYAATGEATARAADALRS